MESQIKTRQSNYKWVVLAMCFMMEFVCLGLCSSNAGLYTGAVTKAVEIPRSLYQIGTSIRYIVQALVGLFFGVLIQKFGIKKLVSVGLISLSSSVLMRYFTAVENPIVISTAAFSIPVLKITIPAFRFAISAFTVNLTHHYIGCVLWGLGLTFAGGTMASLVVRRWFSKDIGKYTGIVMSANGIGGAIAAQIISPLINNGETFGYRKAYLLSAVVSIAISVIVLIFIRDNPTAESAPTKSAKKARGAIWEGIPFIQVWRKPYFYLTFLMILLTGISLQSVGTISIVYMEDLGMNATFIATTATVSSLVLTFSKVFTGFSYDKKGLAFTLLLCHCCSLVAYILKANLVNVQLLSYLGAFFTKLLKVDVTADTIAMVFAMVATILGTIAMPLETVMIPLMTNDLFGSASYAKVLGIFYAANSLGLCLGSPLCDIYRDLTGGSYSSCYWFFSTLMVAVTIGFQLNIFFAQKDKKKILAAAEAEVN